MHAQMMWQSEGEFLAVQLSRRGKLLKDGSEKRLELPKTVDILRMNEKNVPIDTLDCECFIKGFWWEPKSNRFAVLTEHKDSPTKTNLLFYSLANNKCEQVASFELQIPHYNAFYWSPDGSHFVCAALGQGDMLFGRLLPEAPSKDGKEPVHALEFLQKSEQMSLTGVEWDNSGRYLLTTVTQDIEGNDSNFSANQDSGINLWTFQGRLLHSERIEKLWGASFRPTPPSLLSGEDQKSIRKNLKAHSRRLELLDDESRNRQKREERMKRERTINDFRAICETLSMNYQAYASQISWSHEEELYNRTHALVDSIETVEELISCTEEEIAMDR